MTLSVALMGGEPAVPLQRPGADDSPTDASDPAQDGSAAATKGPPALPPLPTEAAPAEELEPTGEQEAASSDPHGIELADPPPPPEPAPANEPSPGGPADPFVATASAEPVERAPLFRAGEDPRDDYVKVERPLWRGTGMLVTSGVLFGVVLSWQTFDTFICGGCGIGLGLGERMMLGGAVGMAAGGAANRGRADAFDDAAAGHGFRDTRPMVIGGAVALAGGLALGLTNESLFWRCVASDEGPYARGDGFCRMGLARGMLDLSAVATTVGVGYLTYGLRYRNDMRRYHRARTLSVVPSMDRDRVGLSVSGRF